jgi:hypothetical protein
MKTTKSSCLILAAVLFTAITGVSPVLAQGHTFRGAAQSVAGPILTVSGGGETHRFMVTRATRVTGADGKPTSISQCLNRSVQVMYIGNREPYHAISVRALEQ